MYSSNVSLTMVNTAEFYIEEFAVIFKSKLFARTLQLTELDKYIILQELLSCPLRNVKVKSWTSASSKYVPGNLYILKKQDQLSYTSRMLPTSLTTNVPS